jgi:hypothetical protein
MIEKVSDADIEGNVSRRRLSFFTCFHLFLLVPVLVQHWGFEQRKTVIK